MALSPRRGLVGERRGEDAGSPVGPGRRREACEVRTQDTCSPQKLEKAGRSLPGPLWAALPVHTWLQASLSGVPREEVSGWGGGMSVVPVMVAPEAGGRAPGVFSQGSFPPPLTHSPPTLSWKLCTEWVLVPPQGWAGRLGRLQWGCFSPGRARLQSGRWQSPAPWTAGLRTETVPGRLLEVYPPSPARPRDLL